MYARIKAAVARAEVERRSARHRSALRQRAEQGKVPFGFPLLGYTTDRNIDPERAEVARRIFKGFYAGESLKSIAHTPTAEGVPTRSGRPSNVCARSATSSPIRATRAGAIDHTPRCPREPARARSRRAGRRRVVTAPAPGVAAVPVIVTAPISSS